MEINIFPYVSVCLLFIQIPSYIQSNQNFDFRSLKILISIDIDIQERRERFYQFWFQNDFLIKSVRCLSQN